MRNQLLGERAYYILGLKPGASLNEAKHAYKKIVKETHPDTRPSNSVMATNRFLDATKAWSELKNGKTLSAIRNTPILNERYIRFKKWCEMLDKEALANPKLDKLNYIPKLKMKGITVYELLERWEKHEKNLLNE